MSTKSKQDINTVIGSVQKILLYIFVVVLPISILPFPWDLTEKGMTLVILFFSLLIGILELLKILLSGKLLFLKRDIDLIIFLLLISYILTTVFAQDNNLSIFGYNYRLSSGLLGIGAVLFLTFLTRSFISTKKDFLNLVNAFLIGSILTSFLSLISLFGGNIFSFIPKIGLPDQGGVPTLGSPVALVIYNSISILLGYISLHMYKNDDEEMDASWFAIVAILVNLISLSLFSIDKKSFLISILFIFLWIVLLIIIFFKNKKLKLKEKINQLILPLIILVLISLFQIDAIQTLFLGEPGIVTPLNLSLDASWQVVSQSLMQSLKNGIFGLGLDSFGVIFDLLKQPELVGINLLNAFNEIFTSLTSGGFLWLVIWILLGWYIVKDFISDIKEYEQKNKIFLLFDTLLLFIYLTSFFTTYTIIIRFSFFLMISLSIILRSIYNQNSVDNVLLKMWAMGTNKRKETGFPVISIFFSVVLCLLLVLGVLKLVRVTLSSVYILRAESYINQENEKLGDRQATEEEERDITNNLYRWYTKALKYDSKNPLTNRKASIVAVDKLGILLQQYENLEDEQVLNEAVSLRNEAFEYSRTAINLSPSLYVNYNNRALVYLGIINLGYTEYVRDAISVINNAIEMKPLDYQNYYNKAQLYYLLQNYDLALESSTKSLSIKGDYIPALILSANINGVQDKTEIQLSYLEAAKTILEENDLQNIQLYQDIIDQIEFVKNNQKGETQKTEVNDENQTKNSEDSHEKEQ
jgi:tetratricopeptide (TPR) repeat protein